ncbi:MAG: NAD-dependent protein deacylase [Anaerolineae bacterium]
MDVDQTSENLSQSLPEPLWQRTREAARLLRQAGHAVALTGAGISTPSGVPDFRSPGTGLWRHVDPLLVASIWAFRVSPRRFFDWMRPLARTLLEARPNPAHEALARLEEAGFLQAVITQNIDGLHQKAGSRTVLELHGHVRTATCTRCYRIYPSDAFIPTYLDTGEVPRCGCGGILKPNVILLGEDLPRETYLHAVREARACDLMLVAGTSLEVAPASELPFIAQRRGVPVIVVNLDPTPLDPLATVVLHADVALILPALAALVLSPEGASGEPEIA